MSSELNSRARNDPDTKVFRVPASLLNPRLSYLVVQVEVAHKQMTHKQQRGNELCERTDSFVIFTHVVADFCL